MGGRDTGKRRFTASYGVFLKTVNADAPERGASGDAGRLLLGLLAEQGPLSFQELRRSTRLDFLELTEPLLRLCRRKLVAADAGSDVRFAITGSGRELLGLLR